MKIKICGITRLGDAQLAADLGADFLGFVFVPESPRYVQPQQAAGIRARVQGPKFVGVFRNAPLETIQAADVDYVQLHGNESEDFVRAIGKPVIKAIAVDNAIDDVETSAEWLLFDRQGGGTGRTFDWSLLAGYARTKPFLLAGGITPDNVAAAISAVRPDAIDLASGVESAPGVKDPAKLRLLFERVRRA